ncbi:MAG: oligoribonuclease [Deltaproteobacteria bacterium]|nr:MAG: oligoribonuclease [Deltaproteobacteria bacterium]
MIWLDLEMSGLDPEQHVILEIACVVTDWDLNIVAEGPDIVIFQPEHKLASMEQWSRQHHAASGLLQKVSSSSISCLQAERQIIEFLSNYAEPGKSPLCGNSVWQDRRFLVRHMPKLEAFFHYRNIDVSTIKEIVKRWYPSLPRFEKQKAHLALNDIKESIRELEYYKNNVFCQRAA